MQQSVPCERALQLLDVELRHEVILAVATALCSGNIDCTHPNSEGILEKEKRRTGDELDLVNWENDAGVDLLAEGEEKQVEEEVDEEFLKADFRYVVEALLRILLHLEAIVNRSR